MPKFGTCLHLGMANNVAKARFQLVSQKNHFSFFECQKHVFFMKRLQRGTFQTALFHVYLKVDPILRTIAKNHAFPTLVATPGHSDNHRPIQLEPVGI
jgi:hypothetical protein